MGTILATFLAYFAVAALAPFLHKLTRGATGWLLALLPAATFAALIAHVSAPGHANLSEFTPWVDRIGLALAFRIDGLATLFLLVITGIAALIFIYAGGYLKDHPQLGRFYAYLMLFTAAMMGLVAADNLLLLFIFWELTSISSYLLIGFKHTESSSRSSALQALLVTGFGGLAFLAGAILLGHAAGDFSLAAINQNAAAIKGSSLYPAAFILVCLGAFTKSAQWPFHFWLPGAMAAPTPVSAFLHSATMVNAGVYLLARLAPALGGTDAWHYTLTAFGAMTMLVGAVLAWPQTDLKRLLAFSTVSALGTMVMLLGLDTALSVKAVVIFFFVHAMYKGALFMVAGTVDHGTGTRDVRELNGLMRAMPLTAVAAGLAAFSMTGLPPLLGFIAKELVYEAQTQTPLIGPYVTTAGLVSSTLIVAVAFIVGIRPFLGTKKDALSHAHEGSFALWLGPMALAVSGLVFGLSPWLLDKSVFSPAISAVRAKEAVISLKLWHGFNVVLALSAATVALGLLAFFLRKQARGIKEKLQGVAAIGPEAFYESLVGRIVPFADRLTRAVQHGRLRLYVATTIAVTVALTAWALFAAGIPAIDLRAQQIGVRVEEVAIVLVVALSAIIAVFVRSRLAAVACLSVVGFGIAGIFGIFGAPDLAITQFLAEALLLVLFILVVYRLPRFGNPSHIGSRLADALLATAAGVVVSLVVLSALNLEIYTPVSDFFNKNALAAKGRNVVNVILVDFRALDTLGEITVLAAAALGVYALISRRARDEKSKTSTKDAVP